MTWVYILVLLLTSHGPVGSSGNESEVGSGRMQTPFKPGFSTSSPGRWASHVTSPNLTYRVGRAATLSQSYCRDKIRSDV